MDMGWGYHQIELDEESKDKAVFKPMRGYTGWNDSTLDPLHQVGYFTVRFAKLWRVSKA